MAPRAGAGIGAIGSVAGWSSAPLAMNMPGTVYSCPLSCEKCNCQTPSRRGAENSTFMASGCPPFREPLLTTATRG